MAQFLVQLAHRVNAACESRAFQPIRGCRQLAQITLGPVLEIAPCLSNTLSSIERVEYLVRGLHIFERQPNQWTEDLVGNDLGLGLQL